MITISAPAATSVASSGRPPAFWELYNNENEMGITVQKFSAGLDCGNPIVEVSINSKNSLSSLKRRVFLYSESMMHEALLKVRNPAFKTQDITGFGKVYTIPNLWQW